MIVSILLFLLGFIFLRKGAEWTVFFAEKIGKKFHISNFLIAFILIAVGTSLPELFVGLYSSWNGNSELMIANIVGANVLNIFLNVGIVALFIPKVFEIYISRKTLYFLLVIFLLLIYMSLTYLQGEFLSFDRYDAVIMLFLYGMYIFENIKSSRVTLLQDSNQENIYSVRKMIGGIVLGLVCLYFGGSRVSEGGKILVEYFGFSQHLIGALILSMGTTLPELTVGIVSIRQKNLQFVWGNILGSLMCNTAFILPLGAIVNPYSIPIHYFGDIAWCIVGILLILFFSRYYKNIKSKRIFGMIFLFGYLFYTYYLYFLIS